MYSLPEGFRSVLRLVTGILIVWTAVSTSRLQAETNNLSSPGLAFARQLNEAFVQVAAAIYPSVVVITVVHPEPSDSPEGSSETPTTPSRQRPRDQETPPRGGRSRRRPMTVASGSGTIITADGYILTNNHVVEGADNISVVLKDGRRFKGRIRGLDRESDLAVIKINASGLIPAKMGSSSAARVGEFVLAVGTPYELDYSVTVGHISAKGRAFETMTAGYQDQDFIQTDTSINPGNSGGPLVNLDGEVVGINSMIRGLRTGIGFAIPSDLAKRVVARLIKDGKFVRSWLGVGIGNLRDDTDFQRFAGNLTEGVIIRQIIPDGPASKSALRPADIVVAVDGKPVETSRQLKDEVSYKESGQVVTLDVVREGKPIRVSVKTEALRDSEKPEPALAAKKDGELRGFGLTVKEVTKDLAAEFKVEQNQGVIVIDVEPDSPADVQEIQPGDLIIAVDRKPVRNLKDYTAMMKGVDLKKGVLLGLSSRGGTKRFTILKENAD